MANSCLCEKLRLLGKTKKLQGLFWVLWWTHSHCMNRWRRHKSRDGVSQPNKRKKKKNMLLDFKFRDYFLFVFQWYGGNYIIQRVVGLKHMWLVFVCFQWFFGVELEPLELRIFAFCLSHLGLISFDSLDLVLVFHWFWKQIAILLYVISVLIL